MIRLRDLALARGGRTLVSGIDVVIDRGERIGLLGRNGCGKSTLLAAIAGDLSPERGDVVVPKLRLARLSQHPPSGTHSLLEHVLRADARRDAIERELAALGAPLDAAAHEATATAASAAQGDRIAALHAEYDEIDGWSAPARAARLLDGLGFAPADHAKPVDALSGGWKMRLDLARVLMTPADLLLLDEPTNHLDLDAVLWLERWLQRFDGTVLVVSHDRDFVDAFATAVLHFENGTLVRYAGGWSDFERQAAERQRLQRKMAAAQAARIEQLERFVERFKAKASKAKQAQSRVKALERLERIVVTADEDAATMRFDSPDQVPEQIASLETVDCGYLPDGGDGVAAAAPVVIVRRARLDLRRGDRIGVLGRNGAGKSTSVRTLVGDLPPLDGEVRHARGLRIGYFAQRQVETLNPQGSALDHLKKVAPTEREQVLREFLAGFGFRGEQAMVPVGPFSGGEKARLALSLIAWTRPQLLVLDEPTNHLDASARDALTAALAEYEGALLLVSHDRSLLRATVDRFVIVGDGVLSPFDGDLDDYRDWLAQRAATGAGGAGAAGSAPTASSDVGSAPDRRDERRAAAASREAIAKLRKPLQSRLVKIEKELATVQTELAALDAQLADPAFYADGQRVATVQRSRADLAKRADALEEAWLELGSEIEALGS